MKKIITLLFFLPFVSYSQSVVTNTVVNTVKTNVVSIVKQAIVVSDTSDEELDEEYIERPFKGEEDKTIYNKNSGLTEQEIYNLNLRNRNPKK